MDTWADFLRNSVYELPPSYIALHPADRRENSKLFIYDRKSGRKVHTAFHEIEAGLAEGDLLVLNSARVDPVRVVWRKATGGEGELLLLRSLSDGSGDSTWLALILGKNLQLQTDYRLPGGRSFRIEKRQDEKLAVITLDANRQAVQAWLERVGLPPLPPYIRNQRKRVGEAETSVEDPERYQTTFPDQPGAVAAPTAGLHFSQPLLKQIERRGVGLAHIHLAVGWGTFQPLTERDWEAGKLHPEWVEISPATAHRIQETRKQGGRIVAVGTTVVRALEWWAAQGAPETGVTGWCELFLRPPWEPAMVDAMVTNFHLPGSSLLALVGGFLGEAGSEKLLTLYREAITEQYRFYSYGDAMLIL